MRRALATRDTADIVRPVVLRDHEVRAILDGRQTQLRRPMVPQPSEFTPGPNRHAPKHPAAYFDAYCGGNPNPLKTPANPRGMSDRWCWWTPDDRQGPDWIQCPFGAPGASLWVREAFKAAGELRWAASEHAIPEHHFSTTVCYRADRAVRKTAEHMERWRRWLDCPPGDPWRSATMMPAWASRLTLRVTDVRAERVEGEWVWVVSFERAEVARG